MRLRRAILLFKDMSRMPLGNAREQYVGGLMMKKDAISGLFSTGSGVDVHAH